MNRSLYIEILGESLLPFVKAVFPDSHRFMADNNPKHTSKDAIKYLEDNGIYWWRTPAESPDLNPIENLWHELKVSTCSIASNIIIIVLFLRSIFIVK